MDEKLLFFSAFLKHPKEIGSITPSSRFLIKKLLENIDFNGATCIVEYGPGTGRITKELLKRAKKDTKIVCFETNKKFYRYLSRNINDNRLRVINDSAENIKRHLKKLGINKVDYVISGLPFSNLPDDKKCIIIEETKDTLNNEGKFVIFQFFTNFTKYLYNYFSKISISFTPLNIPPCFVYVCEK